MSRPISYPMIPMDDVVIISEYFDICESLFKEWQKMHLKTQQLINGLFIDKAEIALSDNCVYVNNERYPFDFINTLDFKKKISFKTFKCLYEGYQQMREVENENK